MDSSVRVCTAGLPAWAQKVIPWRRGKRVFPSVQQNVLFSSGMSQKDRALDRPRRRRMALGRVVTCPEGWMALKRKPRNRALFALWRIVLISKIEAGLGQVSVGK